MDWIEKGLGAGATGGEEDDGVGAEVLVQPAGGMELEDCFG